MMEESTRTQSVSSTSSEPAALRNGLAEQQEILSRLSKELDDYFSLRRL
jgi:hypothetical protein